MNKFKHSAIQYSYIRTYKKFIKYNVMSGDNVLDIGAGYGFLKFLVQKQKAKYLGFEPILSKYKLAKEIYGRNGFIHTILRSNASKIYYDKIFALTVIDEVPDKHQFLYDIKTYMHSKSELFIAVRNLDFPFRKSSEVISSVEGTKLNDMTLHEWKNLFKENMLSISRISKFPRPLISSYSIRHTLKGLFLIPLYYFLPIEKSYMILFKINKINNTNDN